MYLFLVILVCSFVNNHASNSQERLIDLLPDDEKQAFLDKVARRLLNGVKNKDSRYKSNEEVAEEDLNQHSDFVKQVLEEESDNLRRDVANKQDKADDENKMKEIETEKDKGFVSDLEDKNHIDLTLRQGREKRERRRLSRDDDYIPVKTVYDEVDKQESDETGERELPVRRTRSGEVSGVEDIQVRGRRKGARINESPHVQRNVLPYYTKIDNYDPETTKGSDTEEDENVTEATTEATETTLEVNEATPKVTEATTKLVDEEIGKGMTVPIPNDPVEVDSDDNKDDVEETTINSRETMNEDTTEATTDSTDVVETSSVVLTTDVTTESMLTTLKLNKKATKSISANTITEKVDVELVNTAKNSTSSSKKRHLRSNDGSTDINNSKKILDNINADSQNNASAYIVRVEENFDNLDQKNRDLSIHPNNKFDENDTENYDNRDKRENGSDSQDKKDTQNKDEVTDEEKDPEVNADVKNHPDTETLDSQDSGNVNKTYNENVDQYETSNVSKSDNNSALEKSAVTQTKPTDDEVDVAESVKKDDQEISPVNVISNEKHNFSKVDKSSLDSKIYVLRTGGLTSNNGLTVNGTENVETVTVKDENLTDEVKTNSTSNGENTELENVNSNKTAEKFEENVEISNINDTDVVNEEEDVMKDNKFVLTTTEKSYTETNETTVIPTNEHFDSQTNKSENVETVVDKNKEYEKMVSLADEEFINKSVNLKNMLEVLRKGFESLDEKLVVPKKNVKHYQVYEIPEGQAPFIRGKPLNLSPDPQPDTENLRDNENQDQPYYVPVYDYSPKKAYYNAYNRLGPNVDDNDDGNVKIAYTEETIDNKHGHTYEDSKNDYASEHRVMRKFKFSQEKNRNPKRMSQHQPSIRLQLPLVVEKPRNTEMYLNPEDYIDMDYYFGRSNSRPKIPRMRPIKKRKSSQSTAAPEAAKTINSEEATQPYNLMAEQKAKDHISAVRQMLFKKRQFGLLDTHKLEEENDPYITEVPLTDPVTPGLRSRTKNDIIIVMPSEHKHESPDPDISVDYYFGFDEYEPKSKGVRKKASFTFGNLKEPKVNKTVDISELIGEIFSRKRRYSKKEKQKMAEKLAWQQKVGPIRDIVAMGDPSHAFGHLDQLTKMALIYRKSQENQEGEDEEVDVYVNVLKDMIEMDNKALKQYDWLGTTVDVLSALEKLKALIKLAATGESIPEEDKKLLKYILYLYQSAKSSIEPNDKTLRLVNKKKKSLFPKSNQGKKMLKAKGLIDRVWLYFRQRISSVLDHLDNLDEFQKFVEDLERSLFGLHNALKHIALVTKYKKQAWFKNLKEIYLKDFQEKYLLEVLLHLITTRLVDLLDKSAIDGLEDNVSSYVLKNRKEVEKTTDDLVFVLKLLKAFRKYDNGFDSSCDCYKKK